MSREMIVVLHQYPIYEVKRQYIEILELYFVQYFDQLIKELRYHIHYILGAGIAIDIDLQDPPYLSVSRSGRVAIVRLLLPEHHRLRVGILLLLHPATNEAVRVEQHCHQYCYG